jgi:hypothetical protein
MIIPPARNATLGVLSSLLATLFAVIGAAAPAAAPASPSAAAEVVGVLRVEAPATSSFLLRGTLPLPEGAWGDIGAKEPFVVLDYDGAAVPTQCEVVSRYASAQDGVDVAEVLARVTRPPGKKAGDKLQYEVAYQPHAVPANPGPSVASLKSVSSLPANLKALLSNPYSIAIAARDVFGNAYVALPLLSGKKTLLKHGPMEAELRVATSLVPAPPVSGPQGTLPHHLGVTVYLTTNSKDSKLGIDLRFHNAHSGLDPNDPMDDPMGRLYFESITLYAPDGWFYVQDFLDPFLSLPVDLAFGYRAFPLVSATSEGLHGMDWQAQFHRRLMLVPDDKIVEASAQLRGAGLGFATRGASPTSGGPLWSWWNPQTARWFPQSHRLPSLEHASASELDGKLSSEFSQLQQSLQSGTATGTYPLLSKVLGHAHPYGIKYGGMTSGVEIHIYEGIQTLERASLAGYNTARIAMRMIADRMPNVLKNGDAEPSCVEDWLLPLGAGKYYVPFSCFNTPSLSGQDPFGVYAAPTFQTDYVESLGLDAPFVDELAGYDAFDLQHLIRYTRLAKMLVWLENDSLAKDDIKAQAEVFHLSYHQHYNSPGQYVQSTGLLHDLEYIAANGASGFSFGRGEGWGLDSAAAAYATGTNAWRSEHRPWLDEIAGALRDGQSACTGFIQSTLASKIFDGDLRARQIIEQAIVENALLGLIETVYRGKHAGWTADLEHTLRLSTYSMIHPMAWGPGQTSPWAYSAVGPKTEGAPPYCSLAEVPSEGHSSYMDNYQNWSSFAYGFELTGDPIFLQFAQMQIGGDLPGYLLAAGADNVENRAALLALVETALGMP